VGVRIRPAVPDDFGVLAELDLTYPADRVLSIVRSGAAPEHTFRFEWRHRRSPPAVYATPDVAWFEAAASRADLFLMAELDRCPAGYLIVLLPAWTDAGEITDLAVGADVRGQGLGTALLSDAAEWARKRGLRALWVEPRMDNATAIEFYVGHGFRVAGFNDRMYSNEDDPGQTAVYMYLDL
jgi:ribosomal protein S18 acetylase RimI-like enzyme